VLPFQFTRSKRFHFGRRRSAKKEACRCLFNGISFSEKDIKSSSFRVFVYFSLAAQTFSQDVSSDDIAFNQRFGAFKLNGSHSSESFPKLMTILTEIILKSNHF